jgi:hypothetical protein
MKNEPQYPPKHIEDSPSYFARWGNRKRASANHLGDRVYPPPFDIYAPRPKPCLNFVSFTSMDFRDAEWGNYTPLNLLERMTEYERYQLFKHLSDMQLSFSSNTFLEQCLKESGEGLNMLK